MPWATSRSVPAPGQPRSQRPRYRCGPPVCDPHRVADTAGILPSNQHSIGARRPMSNTCDILIFGTGSFAQRIACDLAATATAPTQLTIAGRNGLRLDWIATAARARAHMFSRPVEVASRRIDLAAPEAAGELLAVARPAVILQAASFQSGSVISASGNAWTRLVAEGGLSATAVFQSVLSSRIARAAAQASPQSWFINCCFPDVAKWHHRGHGAADRLRHRQHRHSRARLRRRARRGTATNT
jgi:hypothetical protein